MEVNWARDSCKPKRSIILPVNWNWREEEGMREKKNENENEM